MIGLGPLLVSHRNEDIANAGNLVIDDKGPDEKWGLPSEDRDDIVAQVCFTPCVTSGLSFRHGNDSLRPAGSLPLCHQTRMFTGWTRWPKRCATRAETEQGGSNTLDNLTLLGSTNHRRALNPLICISTCCSHLSGPYPSG